MSAVDDIDKKLVEAKKDTPSTSNAGALTRMSNMISLDGTGEDQDDGDDDVWED